MGIHNYQASQGCIENLLHPSRIRCDGMSTNVFLWRQAGGNGEILTSDRYDVDSSHLVMSVMSVISVMSESEHSGRINKFKMISLTSSYISIYYDYCGSSPNLTLRWSVDQGNIAPINEPSISPGLANLATGGFHQETIHGNHRVNGTLRIHEEGIAVHPGQCSRREMGNRRNANVELL